MTTNLLGIGAVLAALMALLCGLGWWQRRWSPHPELVRKVAHVGMGMTTLGFPWLFDRAWPAWALCAGSLTLLTAVRWWRPLRAPLGGVLGGVGRGGAGEFYFAVAVAIVFTATVGETSAAGGFNLLYFVPVLILTLADATGALVGVRYGRARYTAGDGHKSVEGSLAFFVVAFFSTHVPLLLASGTGRVESLLIGMLLGLLVMLLEAVGGHGTDNLLVPLASFVALRIYLHLSVEALLTRLAVLTCLTALMLAWRKRTYLDDSAPLAAALVLYLSWSLGGGAWLVGPAALLTGYTLLCPGVWREATRPVRHNADAVASVSAAGFAWLFAAWVSHLGDRLLFPFTLTFAAHLGMVALAHLREADRRAAGARAVAEAAGIGVAGVLVPYLALCARPLATAAWEAGVGVAAVAAATALFGWSQKRMEDCPANPARWWRQGSIAALVSLGGLG